MLWVWVMYSSLDLVRRNINRAVSDNMLGDLNIDTNDYNTGQTIYLVSFLVAELPGGLISKKVGPFRYTPAVITLWGSLCMIQTAMKSKWSFFLLRALLGIAQGGFIPEMVGTPSHLIGSGECKLTVFTIDPIPILLLQEQRAFYSSQLLLYRNPHHSDLWQSSCRWTVGDARYPGMGWLAMAV